MSLQLPANDKERLRVLVELVRGKPSQYVINGEVYRLVPRHSVTTREQQSEQNMAVPR